MEVYQSNLAVMKTFKKWIPLSVPSFIGQCCNVDITSLLLILNFFLCFGVSEHRDQRGINDWGCPLKANRNIHKYQSSLLLLSFISSYDLAYRNRYENGWSNLYHYDPIIPVAIVAGVLYTLAFIIVAWQTRKYHKKYMHTVSSTAFCKQLFDWIVDTSIIDIYYPLVEAVGYYIRIYSGNHTGKK